MRLLVGAHEEQHHRQQQTHFDCYREVEDDGQEEGDKQHPEIPITVLEQTYDGLPTTHRISHHDKDGCEARHWDKSYQLP